MANKRRLGITVLTDFILNEGIDPILDNLSNRAGASAVALNPIVTAEATNDDGSWQPPSDAGSSPRVFDRPLWGKRSLWVRSGPSYKPNSKLYGESVYNGKQSNDLTERYGHIVGDFIDAALDRDFTVYFQIPSATPSGLRKDDTPRLPNGDVPRRMANTGSLASRNVRAFNHAFVHDLLGAYPQITGIRLDWPEYPCYMLGEAFQDFGDPVRLWAGEHGFEFDELRKDIGHLWTYMHGSLRNKDLEPFCEGDRGAWISSRLLRRYPTVFQWLLMKAALSSDLLRDWRAALTEAGGEEKQLLANARHCRLFASGEDGWDEIIHDVFSGHDVVERGFQPPLGSLSGVVVVEGDGIESEREAIQRRLILPDPPPAFLGPLDAFIGEDVANDLQLLFGAHVDARRSSPIRGRTGYDERFSNMTMRSSALENTFLVILSRCQAQVPS